MIGLRFSGPRRDLRYIRDNLPDFLDDTIITIEHIAVWKTLDYSEAIYIAFISDEDMSFLKLKYPEMEFDYQKLPLW
jgi:hypothetical protein